MDQLLWPIMMSLAFPCLRTACSPLGEASLAATFVDSAGAEDTCFGSCSCSTDCGRMDGITSLVLNDTRAGEITVVNGSRVYCTRLDYVVPPGDRDSTVEIILYIVCCILLFPTVGFVYKRKKTNNL